MKFSGAEITKFRDGAESPLVHTLSIGIAQADPGLHCSPATIGHHKRAAGLLCHCRVLPDLDHHAASKCALAHHLVRYSQDDDPNEYCHHPLEKVLPDQ